MGAPEEINADMLAFWNGNGGDGRTNCPRVRRRSRRSVLPPQVNRIGFADRQNWFPEQRPLQSAPRGDVEIIWRLRA
jgi:hypothetical protein